MKKLCGGANDHSQNWTQSESSCLGKASSKPKDLLKKDVPELMLGQWNPNITDMIYQKCLTARSKAENHYDFPE